MRRLVPALLCLAIAGPVLADSCLNTDKEKYASNDPRSSDYGKCKSAPGTTNTYGAVGAVGGQIQHIIQRQDEPSDADKAYQRDRENRRESAAEWDRKRFQNLKFVTAQLTVEFNYSTKIQPYPNAKITPEQQDLIQEEIAAAINGKQLLEKYGDLPLDKPWVSSADPAANWKACEVATQLVRAYVYGNFVRADQKNPAKGFAIARAGSEAQCGGTSYWLGRIYEDGDAVAPGVDKVLDKSPQKPMLVAYDRAIVNGITAAYERSAHINWVPPERYKTKTYFDFAEFEKRSYWYDNGNYRRLAYAQFKRCLELEPDNLQCARGINALIKDLQEEKYVWRDELKEINADGKIDYFKAELAKLESALNAQKAAAKP